MRIQSLLLLAAAMICGTVLMFVAGLIWFPLKQTTITRDVPQSQVLVAKKDIPAGTAIRADYVEYRFVPVRSIPVGATVDFRRIYNRKTIYPIAAGTPICDMDLDTSTFEEAKDRTKIPFGMSVVKIQVERIQADRNSNGNFDALEGNVAVSGEESSSMSVLPGSDISAEMLGKVVRPGDTVDLMLIESAQKVELSTSRLPFISGNNRKNSAATGSTKDTVYLRKPSQLIASGLKVYAFSEKTIVGDFDPNSNGTSSENTARNAAPATQPVVSLLMSKDQLEETKKAARLGRLQIVLHSQEESEPAQNVEENTKEESNLPKASSRFRTIVQTSDSFSTANSAAQLETALYNSTKHNAKTVTANYIIPIIPSPQELQQELQQPQESEPDVKEVETEDAFSEVAVESVVEPDDEPTVEPITEPEIASEPVDNSTTKPIMEPVWAPVDTPIEEPIIVTEPIEESMDELVTEPMAEPVVESIDESVTEPKPALTLMMEQVVEPVAESTVEPVWKSADTPIVESTVAAESTVEELAIRPTLAPPFPKISEEPQLELLPEPTFEKNVQNQKTLTLSTPVMLEEISKNEIPKDEIQNSETQNDENPKMIVPEKMIVKDIAPKVQRASSQASNRSNGNRSQKSQQVVRVGLTPLKRMPQRSHNVTVPQTATKAIVKAEQAPPHDSVTREYDPEYDERKTSQDIVRVVAFASGNGKKTNLYPHYFYEPTPLLLSPNRMAIKEQQRAAKQR